MSFTPGRTFGILVISAVARFGYQPAIGDEQIRWSYRKFGAAVGRFITLFAIGPANVGAVSFLSATAPTPRPRYRRRW